MFKMFAVMCLIVYPDDTMSEKLQCTTYYEKPEREFITIQECDQAAYIKIATTIQGFEQLGVDYKSLQVGCGKVKD